MISWRLSERTSQVQENGTSTSAIPKDIEYTCFFKLTKINSSHLLIYFHRFKYIKKEKLRSQMSVSHTIAVVVGQLLDWGATVRCTIRQWSVQKQHQMGVVFWWATSTVGINRENVALISMKNKAKQRCNQVSVLKYLLRLILRTIKKTSRTIYNQQGSSISISKWLWKLRKHGYNTAGWCLTDC